MENELEKSPKKIQIDILLNETATLWISKPKNVDLVFLVG